MGPLAERGLKQAGVILDSTYSVLNTVPGKNELSNDIDIHEFTILDNGRSLYTTVNLQKWNPLDVGMFDNASKYIGSGGFCEQIMATGEVVFEWHSLDHISPAESYNVAEAYAEQWTWWDYL